MLWSCEYVDDFRLKEINKHFTSCSGFRKYESQPREINREDCVVQWHHKGLESWGCKLSSGTLDRQKLQKLIEIRQKRQIFEKWVNIRQKFYFVDKFLQKGGGCNTPLMVTTFFSNFVNFIWSHAHAQNSMYARNFRDFRDTTGLKSKLLWNRARPQACKYTFFNTGKDLSKNCL